MKTTYPSMSYFDETKFSSKPVSIYTGMLEDTYIYVIGKVWVRNSERKERSKGKRLGRRALKPQSYGICGCRPPSLKFPADFHTPVS